MFKRSHATKLGKREKKLERGFYVLCFHERSNVEAWELKRNLGKKLKEKLGRLVVDLASSPLLLMVMLSWSLLVFVVVLSWCS
jgi:hypothetical protein